jgi:hypothetical protein
MPYVVPSAPNALWNEDSTPAAFGSPMAAWAVTIPEGAAPHGA